MEKGILITRITLFIHSKIISSVRRAEFVSDRMFYITIKGCWCDIILNVHAPTEDKDDTKDSFYEELDSIISFGTI
jgi:hypothetical protein